MSLSQSRRSFLKQSSIPAAYALASVVPKTSFGANDRIQIGVIGCGSRGQNALMEEIHRFSAEENVAITAVCDVWKQQRESAAQKTVDWYETKAKTFVQYKELLALPEIDAVVIATPDHMHATILEAAIQSGKDAYCEKPLARNMKELNNVVDIVKESDRVVQLGTQLRSYPSFTGCKKVVQEGKLGQIFKVSQVRNYYRPYWDPFKRPIEEKDTVWDTFLGHVKYRPFDEDQHAVWYGYRDFTDGAISNLMCHFVDLVHYITGATFPSSAVTMTGNYVWKDKRTCPDSVHTLLEYPEGFMVSYSTSSGNSSGNYTRFWGTKGMLDAENWREPYMTGEGSEHPVRVESKQNVPDVDIPQHMQNWLQCLRTREKPNADIDAGYQHAVTCLLADAANIKERKMKFDPKRRRIKTA